MEVTSYHQAEEFEKGQKKRVAASPYVLPTSHNPSYWNPPWLSNACTTRKDPESECLTRDNTETNATTIKREPASHVAEQCSWVPLPCCSPPRCPFPIKSLALSSHVSLDNSFLSVRQEPTLGPWNGCPFLQQL